MGDDDAAGGHLGRHLGEAVGDVFVAEAVEAVAADALVVEAARERVAVGVRGVAAVEGGVEAGDLRHVRVDRHREADRREVVRLVQGRQGLVAGEAVEDRLVDQDRVGEVRAAVHDAMADGAELETFEGAEPVGDLGDGGGEVGDPARVRSCGRRGGCWRRRRP